MGQEVFNIRYKTKLHKVGNSYFIRIPKELVISNDLEDKEILVRVIVELEEKKEKK